MEMSKTNCHSRIIKRRLVWICQASPVNQPFIFLNYLSEHSCYLLVILRSNVNWDLRASLCNGGNTFFSILSPYFESLVAWNPFKALPVCCRSFPQISFFCIVIKHAIQVVRDITVNYTETPTICLVLLWNMGWEEPKYAK